MTNKGIRFDEARSVGETPGTIEESMRTQKAVLCIATSCVNMGTRL